MAFIGRVEELNRLEQYYRTESIRTCAIMGRRRIGKTTLIDRFCEGKPNIRINLVGSEAESILDNMASDIAAVTGEARDAVRDRVRGFDGLIDFLSSLDPVERTVVAIDELPDAIGLLSDVPAKLMRYVDGRLKEQNIFLIICGSSVSAMFRELNDGQRPLFQRFPVQMMLRPLSYSEARGFHPNLSEEDRMRAYAICSGVPLYHELMAGYDSIDEAVSQLFLGQVPPLYLEARNLLSMEVSPQATYNRVLTVMGRGASTLKVIAEKADVSQSRCREMLDVLQLIGYVERRSPYGTRTRQRESKVLYTICDGFMDFHYTVLSGNEALLGMRREDALRRIRGPLDTFYGRRFESICAQYVMSTESCRWCGRWWGRVPETDELGMPMRGPDGKVVTEDMDIDLVAEVYRGDMIAVIMGECKFSRRMCGMPEFLELQRCAEAAKLGGENIEYMMFSREGFRTDLRDFAEGRPDLRIRLVTLEDMADAAVREVPDRTR